MKKDRLIYIITIILSALYIFMGNKAANANKIDYSLNQNTGTPIKARVVKVVDENYASVVFNGYETEDEIILFEAEIMTGYRKGEVVAAIQQIDSMLAVKTKIIEPGDKVVLYKNQNEAAENIRYMFAIYHRIEFIILLWIAFFGITIVLIPSLYAATSRK